MLSRLLGVDRPAPDSTPAIVRAGGSAIRYGELAGMVARRAHELAREGAASGVPVAIAATDPADFIAEALAAWEAGAAVVPLDLRAGSWLADETASRAHAALVLRGPSLPIERRSGRPLDPRAALVLFTSGSSGRPKGVVLGGAGLRANVEAILGYLPIAEHPRTAMTLPLAYSYSLVGQALTTLRAGGTLILLGDVGYPALVLQRMAESNASGLSSVPAALRLLARAALEGARIPALGYVASAGGPLDAATARLIRAAFPNARLFNQYGLTEASPRVAAVGDGDPAFTAGSAGRPLPGVEVWAGRPDGSRCAAGEEGELFVRGPSVMLGYLDDPEATARVLSADGALRTGDRGHLDASGALFVAGRSDGVVKVAGERVGLEEVAALLREAGAREAAVVDIPDEALGARLVAFVEAAEGAVPSLRASLRERLAPAKRPWRIVAVEALPRLPSGKPDVPALRARASALLASRPTGPA